MRSGLHEMATNRIILRNLDIKPPLLLAPMAGLTHSVLRTVLMDFGGVGMLSTEMLSARRLPSENPKISPYLIRTENEGPLSYQLFVTSHKEVAPAIDTLHRFGADAIDLNLGCPAPKVRSAGGGSRLMSKPDTTRRIISTARKLTDLPLTAKIRLGERLHKGELKNLSLMLEGEGLDMLTVHARLRTEGFQRKPRWEWVRYVKEWLSIPIIANGAIFSVEDARACLKQCGADGLMIGRAAPEKPWLFGEIAREVFGVDVPRKEVVLPEIYRLFLEGLNTRFRAERRLGRLKEFTHYFAANYPFGHHLASGVQASRTMDEASEKAFLFFAVNDPDGSTAAGKAFLQN